MQKQVEQLQEVPSLCVRVYRREYKLCHRLGRSLTMREGVSPKPGAYNPAAEFPHYA